jgi:hypothetical protein
VREIMSQHGPYKSRLDYASAEIKVPGHPDNPAYRD